MTNLIQKSNGFGEGGMLLTYVAVSNRDGIFVTAADFGEPLTILLEARANRVIQKPNLGFALNALSGELIYSISTFNLGISLGQIEEGQSCRSSFELEMALKPGPYWLTVIAADIHGAVSGDSGAHHDTHERIVSLNVRPNANSSGFDGVGLLPVEIACSPAIRTA